jgi:integrase
MKKVVPLTDTTIRNLKPTDVNKRLSDGNGLYLLTFVNGGSHGWRLDYTYRTVRKTISLGTYPETSLKLAREKAAQARSEVAAGINPSEKRKADKEKDKDDRELQIAVASGVALPGTFESLAREWFALKSPNWSLGYGEKVMRRLEADVFPWIGKRAIHAIAPPEMLEVLRRVEARGVIETAHRVKESCGQVFRYAIMVGKATSDPSRDLKDALKKPNPKNFAAIISPDKLAELLRAIDGYSGTYIVRTALKLAPMLMLRPGELRFANWSEFDLKNGIWTIPSNRMKRIKEKKEKGEPHIVFLPRQAVMLLQDLKPLTGPNGYVFRGEYKHDRAMSENTINAALRRMGYDTQKEVTGHGFRATARTMLEEQLKWDPKIMEAQLAHSVSDSLGTSYNRTQFLEQRKEMMQVWADYLDGLRKKGVSVASLQQPANSENFLAISSI